MEEKDVFQHLLTRQGLSVITILLMNVTVLSPAYCLCLGLQFSCWRQELAGSWTVKMIRLTQGSLYHAPEGMNKILAR